MNESSNGRSTHKTSEPGPFPSHSWLEERAAAQQRKNDFPYRFPRDPRQLGGKFSVAENARRLLRFFYFERRLAQAIGAWTLAISEFEVKQRTRELFSECLVSLGAVTLDMDVFTVSREGIERLVGE